MLKRHTRKENHMCDDPAKGDFNNLMKWAKSYMWRQIVEGEDPTYELMYMATLWAGEQEKHNG